MAVNVLIPTQLHGLTHGQDTVHLEAVCVAELLTGLEANYPGMGNRVNDEGGNLRRFINLFVNGEDIRFLQLADTPLKDGDEVSIVPAITGG